MNASMVSTLSWHPPSSTIQPLLTIADVEHSQSEERWFSIGMGRNGILYSVFYLWSDADPAAIKIRLISARKATHAELRHYEESL